MQAFYDFIDIVKRLPEIKPYISWNKLWRTKQKSSIVLASYGHFFCIDLGMSWLGKNSGGKEIFLVFQGVCSSMKHLWELLFTSSIHAGSVEKSGFLAIDGVAFNPCCGSGFGCVGHIWTSESGSVFPADWIQLQIPLECVIYKLVWTYSWASKNF